MLLVGLVTSLAVAPVSAQDFDPKGRKKPGKGQVKPGGGGAKPGGGGAKPGGAKPGGDPGGGGGAKPGGTNPGGGGAKPEGVAATVLIERYTRVVLAQPGSPFPLQRLAQLYRERDGNIVALVKDFEARAAASGDAQYASLVSLGGVYKIDGRTDDAVKAYERSIGLKSTDPVAILALARLHQDRADLAAARTRYEQALALQTVPQDREQTLRTLMTLALDTKDWTAAKGFHDKLVAMGKASLFVKGELGRELFSRGEYVRAESEFKDLVNAAQGDNRALGPALKELGRAQAKAGKNPEALATLKRALGASGSEAAVRTEIYEIIAEVYRKDQKLPMLIKDLENEHPSDFQRLKLLGSLYEETGDATKALATYRKALGANAKDLDLRLKVVRLLQSQGEIDKAIAEYESLVRAAPNNPTFVFELTEALLQRGDRARALRVLTEVESRAGNDEEVLSRLADFYGRIGESDKSVKVLTRLSQMNSGDPSHLVDLGDRYFQDGNVALAVSTWKRILTTVTPRAKALSALGDVYLEHDMSAEALASFREAVQLDKENVGYKKQLAGALERTRAMPAARAIWEEIAQKAKDTNDRVLAREARTRLVTLWSLEKSLESRVPQLVTKFGGKPPDVEAGRMLAECQLHLRKLPDAEATLRKVIELAPGDGESYLALERVLVQESSADPAHPRTDKIAEAIAVLEKLVAVEPKRALELYDRMARYAQQIYRDDDAIKYAARAVELNPENAEGHLRLGDRYRSRQDTEKAIVEYRAAIAKNDRLFMVYFQLADLLLAKGGADEADLLFRRVIRGAPDDELVARAARLATQIHMGRGTLESLEQELLPLAIGNPQRPIFRRLLVEVYGNLTFSLVRRTRVGTGKDAEEARAQLAQIGSRAIKPLLDALSDTDVGQQRIAIDVLSYVQNKNAGASLFSFATGTGDTPLRTRAMLACGALKDPALLPRYEGLLFPKSSDVSSVATDQVAVAATYAVAKLGTKSSVPILRRLLHEGTPEMRTFAVFGLAAQKDKSALGEIAQTARAPESGTIARAASAFALGELRAESELPLLLSLAQGSDLLPKRMAILALARLETAWKDKRVAEVVAASLFLPLDGPTRVRTLSDKVREAAVFALAAGGKGGGEVDLLPIPESPVDAEAFVLSMGTAKVPVKDRAAALVRFAGVIESAALAASATSTERAMTLLDGLGNRSGALEPLLTADEAAQNPEAREAALRIGRNAEAGLLPLARHQDPQVRARVLTFLAHSDADPAIRTVAEAVSDPDEQVVRLALAAIGQSGHGGRSVDLVAGVAEKHPSWPVRMLAVEALGKLGQTGGKERATGTLRSVAVKDSYALVREAALVQLSTFDDRSAKSLAADMSKSDVEPRVRSTAAKVLAGTLKGEKM